MSGAGLLRRGVPRNDGAVNRQSAPRSRLPRTVWVLGFVSLLKDLSPEIYHALLPVFITVTLGLPTPIHTIRSCSLFQRNGRERDCW